MAESKREALRYRIGWTRPNDHLFDIRIEFTAGRRNPELSLPVWRPGRYLRQNYAANVRQWRARIAGGPALPMDKTEPSRWRVQAARGDRIVVEYRFYAGVLDAGSSFLDESEAYFNGSNLFMMVALQRQRPIDMEIVHPAAWKVETQLESTDGPPGAVRRKARGTIWRARDFDHLIDSPTIASPSLITHAFEESGATIRLVFQSAVGIDTEQYVEPVRRIVRFQAALFGGLPLRDYRFLYHVGDRWHGVEHEDSSSIMLRRDQLEGARPGDEGYDHFLAITAHEFFHLWNVKRIVPLKFTPYDYSAETPSRLLWAMEGITSYYGERTLLRAGLWTMERYFKHLAGEIQTLESAPGREFLSLAQASFDGWLQDPAQMHDKSNAWISFYNKGEIVSALLDLEIRRQTRGRRSLDDVMRLLWQDYGRKRRGMPEDGIERAVAKVVGKTVRRFFERFIEGVQPLPYDELLRSAGIEMVWKRRRAGEFWLGVIAERREGRLVLESVVAGSPAAAAGLRPNDEIIAVGQRRIASKNHLDRVLKNNGFKPVPILLARNREIIQREIAPAEDPSFSLELRPRGKATPAEERRRREWLETDE
jgi:predicted metalloprotease with PDZ domain